MKPVFEDDFWDVTIDWSKPIPYERARDQGSDYDGDANLYMISARYSASPHKAVYIGKTFKQDIQTRLKQPDHRSRYAAIVKNYPKHKFLSATDVFLSRAVSLQRLAWPL